MNLIYLLKGLAIGFSLAAPVGPIGILCIRRTLAQGSKRGIIIGLSAASADMVYGIVAAFGVTLISNFISQQQHWIRLVGGIFLFILGYHTFFSHPATDTITNGKNGDARTFVSTFLLTLTNPMTLFAFAVVFAGIGLDKAIGYHVFAIFFVAGIFLGSLSWFSLLTSLVHFFREIITTDGLVIINKVAGCLLTLFGAIALWVGLRGF
ncbi:MAG: LysE family transporter [Bacteroidota bacterium]|jgi:threonine/homoserine/homoserine lactone efflux protein